MGKIEQVATSILSFPLDPPFRAAVRVIGSVEYVLAEVRTADGVTGYGYCFAFGRSDAAVLLAALDGLAEVVTGQNAAEIAALWRRMWDSLVFLGQGGAGISALGAVDMALWDIAGKAAALPLFRMLGGGGAPVPVYGSSGSLGTPDADLVREMEAYAQAGYGAVKMKIGLPDFAHDLARVAAVRRAIGPGVKLIVDANQRWSAQEAIRAGARLAEYDLWWLEEPIAAHRIEELAAVRASVPMAVATGETNFTPGEFERLLRAAAADILTPNLQRVGGISAWRDVAAAARLRDVGIASHVYPEINAHLISATSNGLVLEVIPWWPRLFEETLTIRDGRAQPPSGPGLGLTPDPAVIARHLVA
jgi:L-alanine-DL-glutamate epimerase-like enolase superfamily enzyme